MQELEKESSESGEAIPGSLIKPFLNSHPHKLCQEAPQSYSSVKLFPGSHKGSWQGQMSNLSCRLAHAGLGLKLNPEPRAHAFIWGAQERIAQKARAWI